MQQVRKRGIRLISEPDNIYDANIDRSHGNAGENTCNGCSTEAAS